ncbi:hypothetical protein LguiA_000457 [Lonicera macranthoides]
MLFAFHTKQNRSYKSSKIKYYAQTILEKGGFGIKKSHLSWRIQVPRNAYDRSVLSYGLSIFSYKTIGLHNNIRSSDSSDR